MYVDNLHRWACGHSETTPEDGEGRAICLRCGGTVTVRYTAAMLNASMDAALKQGHAVRFTPPEPPARQ